MSSDPRRGAARSLPAGAGRHALGIVVSMLLVALLAPALLHCGGERELSSAAILSLAHDTSPVGQGAITYPQEGTLFPPEIVAPTFLWKDETSGVDE